MFFKSLKRFVITLMVLYVAILLFLMANETYLVYPGSKYPRGNWTPTDFSFQEIEFQSRDGTKLVGWYLPAPAGERSDASAGEAPTGESTEAVPSETVLLCHGNAENVAQSAASNGDRLRRALNADVFVFDYRGFGKSEGKPFEQGVLEDSEAALDWLSEKSGKTAEQIVLVGHSIGGGPAVHLAADRGAKVLVLQRTFNALVEPAQKQYPWLPIRYVMRNQYPSAKRIRRYDGPVFQSHGTDDRLIPIEMGRDLFDAAPTEAKYFFAVDGMTHWDPLPETYWSELAAFVQQQ